jgi:Protein of unknown function (DUF2851)
MMKTRRINNTPVITSFKIQHLTFKILPVTERLLQFIWQFQYFTKSELATTAGEIIQVIIPGQWNSNQGPDFTNAKIRVGNTLWAGSIELHIHTSDWKRHRHQDDKNYRNVILHVVWKDDGIADTIPVLELKTRVPKLLLQRYEQLMNSAAFIPCEKSIPAVNDITWKSWKERLIAERLLRKSKIVGEYLAQNNFHWEETFWWLLARNFGMKVNADAFEAMARSISLRILAKHRTQLQQVEALIFGQTGILEKKFREKYPGLLQREYNFLKEKYGLLPIFQPLHFLRMRPGNFPTVRLAELATLIYGSVHLFSTLKDALSLKEARSLFQVTASDYWHHHYRFDEKAIFKKKKPGAEMIDNIMINTVVPVLFAYGNYHDEIKYKEKALEWLEKTSAENNSIIRRFQQSGIETNNAFDSQSLIELKNEYCNKKRCLDCAVGNWLLKS